MKRMALGFGLSLTLAAGHAAAGERVQLKDIAGECGLSEKQVAMVLGPSTAYAQYRPSYVRSRAQLVRTYGYERYVELAAAYQRQISAAQADASS